MILKFTVQSPPFSINSAYYNKGRGKPIRTRECRAWGDNIMRQLASAEMQDLFNRFKAETPLGSPLAVKLTFHHEVYKKHSNEISRKGMDLSNVEKLLIDLIFDERFSSVMIDGKPGTTYSSLSIDDKTVMELHSRKVQRLTDQSSIDVEIRVLSEMFITE